MWNRVSPKWVCIPEITSDSEWFLSNTNSRGWTPSTGTHDWFYFFHNAFSCDNFTRTLEITLKSWLEAGNNSWVWMSVEEKTVVYSAFQGFHHINPLWNRSQQKTKLPGPNWWCSNLTCYLSYTVNTMAADAMATLSRHGISRRGIDQINWTVSSLASEDLILEIYHLSILT